MYCKDFLMTNVLIQPLTKTQPTPNPNPNPYPPTPTPKSYSTAGGLQSPAGGLGTGSTQPHLIVVPASTLNNWKVSNPYSPIILLSLPVLHSPLSTLHSPLSIHYSLTTLHSLLTTLNSCKWKIPITPPTITSCIYPVMSMHSTHPEVNP